MNKDITYGDTVDYDIFRREQSRVRDWEFRVMLEAQCHKDVCVLTLTYDDEHLPEHGALSLRDYQLFLKMLRKHVYPKKIRFFGCGEYGSKGKRPHYHIIIFGYCPDDLQYFYSSRMRNGNENKFYQSRTIAKLWSRGFVNVCPTVCPEVIPYVCKYLQKLNQDYLFWVDDDGVRRDLPKPFITMSRRPGIGCNALDTALIDVNTDKLYFNGKSIRIPRYFLDKLQKEYQEKPFAVDVPGLGLVFSDDMNDFEKECRMPDTPIDNIKKRRRDFWQGRFDCEQYEKNLIKFKKFKNER